MVALHVLMKEGEGADELVAEGGGRGEEVGALEGDVVGTEVGMLEGDVVGTLEGVGGRAEEEKVG